MPWLFDASKINLKQQTSVFVATAIMHFAHLHWLFAGVQIVAKPQKKQKWIQSRLGTYVLVSPSVIVRTSDVAQRQWKSCNTVSSYIWVVPWVMSKFIIVYSLSFWTIWNCKGWWSLRLLHSWYGIRCGCWSHARAAGKKYQFNNSLWLFLWSSFRLCEIILIVGCAERDFANVRPSGDCVRFQWSQS